MESGGGRVGGKADPYVSRDPGRAARSWGAFGASIFSAPLLAGLSPTGKARMAGSWPVGTVAVVEIIDILVYTVASCLTLRGYRVKNADSTALGLCGLPHPSLAPTSSVHSKQIAKNTEAPSCGAIANISHHEPDRPPGRGSETPVTCERVALNTDSTHWTSETMDWGIMQIKPRGGKKLC